MSLRKSHAFSTSVFDEVESLAELTVSSPKSDFSLRYVGSTHMVFGQLTSLFLNYGGLA